MTLIAQEATMATTQLARAVAYQACWPAVERESEYSQVRMNWVVVTDQDGNRQLRMCWRADRR
jgi:hypothetical protein